MFTFLVGETLTIQWGNGHTCQAIIVSESNTDKGPIVRMPAFRGGYLCLPANEPLYITYIHGDKLYTFRSQLESIRLEQKEQTPVQTLTRPTSICVLENPRHTERVFADLPVRVYINDEIFFGMTVDVSAGGVLLRSKSAFDVGQVLSLEISLGKAGIISATAKVMRQEEFGTYFHYGMAFVQIDAHQLQILETFIIHMLESMGVNSDFEEHELEQIERLLSCAG